MLNSHDRIAAYSELFLENGQGKPTWGGEKDTLLWATYYAEQKNKSIHADRRALLFRYLDELYAPRQAIQSIGFKLMYGQAGAFPDLCEYFVANDVRIIHLIRRNLLDIVVSKALAEARDAYHARVGDDLLEARIHLDTSDLLHRLRWEQREVQRATERFAALSLPYMEVLYEHLAADDSQFGRLLEFLGVKPGRQRLRSSLRRMNTATHRQVIVNYDSVRRCLHGTEFAEFLR